MEPRASAPHRRLETVRRLSEAASRPGCSPPPMIPFINDAELEAILERAREAGALGVSYTMLRLPLEIADPLPRMAGRALPPTARSGVMERVRDTRGGKDYDSTFGQRMRGTGPVAELLAKRFRLAVKRLGFPGFPALDCSGFVPPLPEHGQLPLLWTGQGAPCAVRWKPRERGTGRTNENASGRAGHGDSTTWIDPGPELAAGCQTLPAAIPFPGLASVATGAGSERKNVAGNVCCGGFMG